MYDKKKKRLPNHEALVSPLTVVSSGAIGKSVRGGEYRRYVGRVPWVIRFHTTCKMLAADPAVLCGHPGASVFPECAKE